MEHSTKGAWFLDTWASPAFRECHRVLSNTEQEARAILRPFRIQSLVRDACPHTHPAHEHLPKAPTGIITMALPQLGLRGRWAPAGTWHLRGRWAPAGTQHLSRGHWTPFSPHPVTGGQCVGATSCLRTSRYQPHSTTAHSQTEQQGGPSRVGPRRWATGGRSSPWPGTPSPGEPSPGRGTMPIERWLAVWAAVGTLSPEGGPELRVQALPPRPRPRGRLTGTVTAVHREMVRSALLRDGPARDVGHREHLLARTHAAVLVLLELLLLHLKRQE